MSRTLGQLLRSVRANLREPISSFGDEYIKQAINDVIDLSVSDDLYIEVADETLTQADDTYEYPLTGGELANLHYIYDIYLETETTGLFFQYPVPRQLYQIEYASTPYILFDRNGWTPEADKKIRVVGAKPQAYVDDDNDSIYLPPAYVTWKALSLCHSSMLLGGSGQRLQFHNTQIGLCEQRAELARATAIAHKLHSRHKLIPNRI